MSLPLRLGIARSSLLLALSYSNIILGLNANTGLLVYTANISYYGSNASRREEHQVRNELRGGLRELTYNCEIPAETQPHNRIPERIDSALLDRLWSS
jgi:hypothetical protein